MIHALSNVGRLRLQSHLQKQPLLAFDFDGTLAPIVPVPADARLPRSTHALLATLTARWPCVVVSGRARADVLGRLEGLAFVEVVGNHGSEPWIDLAPLRAFVSHVLPSLTSRLQGLRGVEIEDKGTSISVHYRRVFARHQAIATTLAVAKSLRFERVVPGKFVLNLLPPGALDKGQGLLRCMQHLGRSSAVYIGDDTTDERAFSLPHRCGVLGVRVGYQKSSRARLFLRQQREIEPLLHTLLLLLGR